MKEKKDIIKEINELYSNSKYAVVVDFKGLNSVDTYSFRGELYEKCGCRFHVVKNTLNKVAAKGTEFEKNINLNGQCGIIFCNDILNVSKVINDFCFKTNKIKLVSCLNGENIISEEKLKELALLPSIEVLRTKLLYVLKAVSASVVRAMAERIKQQGSKVESK